jgi:hypothetical protein
VQADVTVSQFFPFTRQLTREQEEVLEQATAQSNSIIQALLSLVGVVNGRLGLGHPAGDDLAATTTPSLVDNFYLAWATVKFTDINQLGAGSSSPVTVTHNFNLPVYTFATPGPSTISLCNVRWIEVGWQRGDKTETSAGSRTTTYAAPTVGPTYAIANAQTFSILREVGDPITSNSIDLRFHCSVEPTDEEPIYVDFLMIPAVR